MRGCGIECSLIRPTESTVSMPCRLASPKQHSLASLYTEAVPPPSPRSHPCIIHICYSGGQEPTTHIILFCSINHYIPEKPGAAEGFPGPAKRVAPGEGENTRQRCTKASYVDRRPTAKHYSYHRMVTITPFGKRKDERGKNTNNPFYTRRTTTIRRPVQTQRPTRGVGVYPFRTDGHLLYDCPRCGWGRANQTHRPLQPSHPIHDRRSAPASAFSQECGAGPHPNPKLAPPNSHPTLTQLGSRPRAQKHCGPPKSTKPLTSDVRPTFTAIRIPHR